MPNERPHILVLMTDQHRGDCLGVAGHPCVETPHLDQLAHEGAYFPRAYTASPACVPARMTFMTGQTAYRLGWQDNSGKELNETETLPAVLGRSSYQTRGVGKMHFTPQRACYGFDNVVLNESGRYSGGDDYHRFLMDTPYAGMERAHSIGNNDVFARRSIVPETHHINTWTANQAIDTLDTRDPTRPLFLFCSFSRPHSPYDPPAPYDEWYDPDSVPLPLAVRDDLPPQAEQKRAIYDWDQLTPKQIQKARSHYLGQITHIDHQIGRVCGAFKRNGMWDNTLAMFFADHGDMMGDFGLFFKTHFWEGSARIPMIMRPPKAWDDVERGVTYDGVVDIMDIFPTMTEAAGATSDSPVDGTSLLPTVKGGDPVGDRVFYGEWRHGSHDRMEVCLIDRNMKYIWHQWGGLEELFDLDRDPTEQTNLFGGISDTEKNRWRQGIIDRVASRPEQEMVRDGVLVANHDPMQDEQVLRVQEPFGRRSF